jgi:DUF4097 and DUF4098 domain-containing protein YvlB
MRILQQTALAAAAVLMTGCVDVRAFDGVSAEGRFARDLTVSGPVELDVRTGSGDIDVRPGGGNSVRITARIRARGEDAAGKVRRIEADPPIEQQGNVIRIGRIEDRELRRNVSISYEISTPRDTRLAAHSGSGDVVVEGIGNGLAARTGSGDIRVRGVAGAFSAHTGSGEIVGSLAGSGDVNAWTGSGDIDVRGVRGGLQARTGSGDVSAEGMATGAWDIKTGSGDVEARLAPEASFDVRLTAGSGRLSLEHPLASRTSTSRHRLEGRAGSGGPLISVTTGSGDVRVQ